MKKTIGKIGLGLAGAVAAVGILSAGVQTSSAEIALVLDPSLATNPDPIAPNNYEWAYTLSFQGTVNNGDYFIMTGFQASDFISGAIAINSTDWSFSSVTNASIPIWSGTTNSGVAESGIQGIMVSYTGTTALTGGSTTSPLNTTLTMYDKLGSQNTDKYWWSLSNENTSGGNSGSGNVSMPDAVNITGQPLPLPAAFWPGLLTLGGMAVVGGLRMRRRTV